MQREIDGELDEVDAPGAEMREEDVLRREENFDLATERGERVRAGRERDRDVGSSAREASIVNERRDGATTVRIAASGGWV